MAVPKRRKSPSKSAMGRANKGTKPVKTQTCKKCGATILPHRVCPQCGDYGGRLSFQKGDTD